MQDIDLTAIDNYTETFDQCDTLLSDSITYLYKTIIPFLGNFTEIDKQDQLDRINEIVSFSAYLTYLLKTVYNLDINKGTSQHYSSEEQRDSEEV